MADKKVKSQKGKKKIGSKAVKKVRAKASTKSGVKTRAKTVKKTTRRVKTSVKATKTATKSQVDVVKTGKPVVGTATAKRAYKPPIVGLMGHVDHGKTSLLDAIRSSNLTEKEFGGITQHISAYQATHQGKKITFIDTPGHKAFSEMRGRGAKTTDIIVLVVAADDGVQAQTKEVIELWKKSGDKLIVAINKSDKEDADPRKVKQELANNGVLVEGFGGDVPVVEVSALKKTNIDTLLDMILLVAEMEGLDQVPEVKNADYIGEGVVLESRMDQSLGPVGLVIVRAGEFKRGSFVAGAGMVGKVRALIDEGRNTIAVADVSQPVMVVGMPKVMALGELVRVYADEKRARAVSEAGASINIAKEEKVEELKEDIVSQLFSGETEEERHYLNVIIKCDTAGTLEAVRSSLLKVKVEGVTLSIIRDSTGTVSEEDVGYAKTTRAIVLGFNVKIDPAAERFAKQERVVVRSYNVIYELIEEVEGAMQGLVEPDVEEVEIGTARVKKTFELSDKTIVAGCIVTGGKVKRNAKAHVLRDKEPVHEGVVKTLRHGKEDEKEVSKDVECGIILDPQYSEIRQGDIIRCVGQVKA